MKSNKAILVIISILFLLTLCLVSLSCSKILNSSKAQEYGKELKITGSEDFPLIKSSILGELSEEQIVERKTDINLQSIFTLLPSNFLLQGSAVSSLNRGFQEEYVIAYATQEDLSVKLLITSYDVDTKKYQFVKQLETLLYGLDSVDISVRDITGDNRKEIVLIGKNEEKEHMINVFRLENEINNPYEYVNIFSMSATGIDILEKNIDRYGDETDIFLQVYYQIVVYNESEEGDIQREYFQWDENSSSFIRASIDRFTSNDVSQEKLLTLHQAKDNDFQMFLKGLWQKEASNIEDDSVALFFSSSPTQISIYFQEKAHIYHWQYSYRSIARYGGIALQINLKSLILPSILNWVQVEILAEDRIYVYGSSDLPSSIQGEYKKTVTSFNDNIKSEILNSNSKNLAAIKSLTGGFSDTLSQTIYIFEYPTLRIIQENKDISTYYSIFELDTLLVLEIAVHNSNSNFYAIRQDVATDNWMLTPMLLYADAYYINRTSALITLSKNS